MFKRLHPLFNVEGAQGGGEPAGGNEPTGGQAPAATSNSDAFKPGWGLPPGKGNDGNQAAAQANPLLGEPQVAPQPQVFDFAGRKIEVTDPTMLNVLKDVHKDYSSLQSTYTQTTNQVKDLQAQNQTFMQLVQNMQQQAPAAQQQAPAQEAPVDLEQVKADFMEKFYDNPLEAIQSLLEDQFSKKVTPVIEPFQKEQAWNQEVSSLSQKYDDFNSMIDPMKQLIQEMPHLAQHGLESVYQLAKRSQPTPQPTPEQLLGDPAFREKVFQNQDITQQVVSQYLQSKQQTNQQIPNVMAGQPGGSAPSAPETRPTDIRGGSKAWLRSLGL